VSLPNATHHFLFGTAACVLLVACLPAGGKVDSASTDRSSTVDSSRATVAAASVDATVDRQNYGESPLLRDKVAQGTLPPLSERLPDNPLVVNPITRPGRYGGTIQRAVTADIIDRKAVSKTFNDNLMAFERPLNKDYVLNLAESFEYEGDGHAIVFKLRKGTRWSDGHPFTVDDILFWYEDIALDENARNDPLFPSRWLNAGRPVKLEKIDDWTLRISSHKPLGSIFSTLCYDERALPKHYFSPYHPRYNASVTYEALGRRISRAQLEYHPGTPKLSAWAPVKWVRGQKALFARNPYYWKIDTAGNQLPYADFLEFAVIPNSDVILLKFLNGELDIVGRYIKSDMF